MEKKAIEGKKVLAIGPAENKKNIFTNKSIPMGCTDIKNEKAIPMPAGKPLLALPQRQESFLPKVYETISETDKATLKLITRIILNMANDNFNNYRYF